MAGINHRIITKGFRDNPAAVIAGVFLLLQVLSPSLTCADYRISTSKEEIVTQSYWIANDMLYPFEDVPPIELSAISSIKEGSFTALEKEMNLDAVRRFFRYSSWLVTREDEILALQKENLEAMKAIDGLRASEEKKAVVKKAVKALSARLDDLEEQVLTIRDCWSRARIPEKAMMLARDVKYLHLMSLRSSIRQCRRYIKTWDPTCREYALEHNEQAELFEKGFHNALVRSMERYDEGHRPWPHLNPYPAVQ